ncbi:hypothetical protein EDEG_02171 [Edhazardia aedis USNM 41457]|uniref:Uncharacterized protein n=1 Tax=Edhazardia aedis (strain USNM 41457) TaxID=1003232 RepID=J9DQ76_EDHAE|nr:hypothetical protein EDEG_02171 [Edhazardia aedis USNM 41457]|eukprot:EJW03497.1 hypothetical protein EDEG_02171 [Edhazardia aedis USNM 41457]
MFLFFATVICRTYMIKRLGSEEYLQSSFDPISLPYLGPKATAHVFEIAHPEADSKISILRLACVPRMKTIPDVVLDATKENDKVTYYTYNEKLKNEELMIVRYEDGYLIVRGDECITYNRKSEHFFTTVCEPSHPEQKFELIEETCLIKPQTIPLAEFISRPPQGISPLIKS